VFFDCVYPPSDLRAVSDSFLKKMRRRFCFDFFVFFLSHFENAKTLSSGERRKPPDTDMPSLSHFDFARSIIATQPQNNYIELWRKRHGYRFDHFERKSVLGHTFEHC
jgi:hypothetical protein